MIVATTLKISINPDIASFIGWAFNEANEADNKIVSTGTDLVFPNIDALGEFLINLNVTEVESINDQFEDGEIDREERNNYRKIIKQFSKAAIKSANAAGMLFSFDFAYGFGLYETSEYLQALITDKYEITATEEENDQDDDI